MTDPKDNERPDTAGRILELIDGEGRQRGALLIGILYDELRSLAAKKIASDPAGAALDPTSLVHRAYLRLVGDTSITWESRGHFFAAAAEAMRRVLVDRARELATKKRGGDRSQVTLDSTIIDLKEAGKADVLDVNEALHRLEQHDDELASIVKLRFFAGLTIEQVSLALNLNARTVDRRWSAARAWLISEMEKMSGSESI